jgi:pyruvate formate lyase activating enzyme
MAKEKMGIITEIKKFATHDGPGIRTTVFIKGCSLKCKWCANPETQKPETQLYFISSRCKAYGECIKACSASAISVDVDSKIVRGKCSLCMECIKVCPSGALKKVGTEVSVEDVMTEIEKDIPFYGGDGGLTLSGGEPLYQPEFIIELLKRCREKNISTVLDTSGFANSKIVEEVLKYTDLILLDIKHMDSHKHKEGTGVCNELILENAKLMSQKTKVRISLPLIPDFNNSKENLERTGEFLKSLGIEWVDINPLHALGTDKYRYLGMQSPYIQFRQVTKDDIREAIKIMRGFGLKTTVGRMM